MAPLDDPFAVVLKEIEALRAETRVVIVDMHAEATSEKIAMGWHLDGRATAVVGTHTHVQTADERVLPRGTAYITDVGMTGPHDSIIGIDIGRGARRISSPGCRRSSRSRPATRRLHAVVVTADPATGRASAIERLSLSVEELEALVPPAASDRGLAMSDLVRHPVRRRRGSAAPGPRARTSRARRRMPQPASPERQRAHRWRSARRSRHGSSRSTSRGSCRTARSGRAPDICISR